MLLLFVVVFSVLFIFYLACCPRYSWLLLFVSLSSLIPLVLLLLSVLLLLLLLLLLVLVLVSVVFMLLVVVVVVVMTTAFLLPLEAALVPATRSFFATAARA